MGASEQAGTEMSFLEHLEQLRWHLIRATVAILIGGTVAFIAKGIIFDVILFGPRDINFPTFKILCNISKAIGLDQAFCLDEIPYTLQSRKVAGQFSAHMWTSITAGFIVAFPYVIYEFWKFIGPGLYENERKTAGGFIWISSLLFFIGVLFGYYVVTPLSLNFLGSYQVSTDVLNEYDLESYIGLVRASVLASGLIFELPIVIYFLTKIGLVTPEFLRKYRKMSLVVVLILSAVITPPDVTSQIIVAIPVLILYEISIFVSKRVIKNQRKKEAAAKAKR